MKRYQTKVEKMDLLFLPSKSEGFPKVILEVAACGIPSMVYSDYGAKEWMKHMQDGFIIANFDDAIRILKSCKLIIFLYKNIKRRV